MITIVAIILERDIISIWPGGRERETGEQQTSTATATTKINKQQATKQNNPSKRRPRRRS